MTKYEIELIEENKKLKEENKHLTYALRQIVNNDSISTDSQNPLFLPKSIAKEVLNRLGYLAL